MHSIRQHIELFHLVFLENLGRKIDKRLYVLKGGCNLRFYFKSPRYSEDIDFDAQIISPTTLRKNITNILESKNLHEILRARKIIIENVSSPKQTETTQRWKLNLNITGASIQAHTKIEFSRRNKEKNLDGIMFESVDGAITQQYHLPPIFLSHYDRNMATLQKISALAGRSITQARDIFDLFLLTGGNNNVRKLFSGLNIVEQNKIITKAQGNLKIITFNDFQSQVVTYLSPEYQNIYASKDAWLHMIDKLTRFFSGE